MKLYIMACLEIISHIHSCLVLTNIEEHIIRFPILYFPFSLVFKLEIEVIFSPSDADHLEVVYILSELLFFILSVLQKNNERYDLFITTRT